ncbi:MAG TPA: NADH-quinone oxidoreductase subunit C, partial [Thermoanaerobaculia bacterium]
MPTLAPPAPSSPAPPPPAPDTATEAAPAAIREAFPAGSITPQEGLDQETWIVRREVLLDLARTLRDDPRTQFDLLMDVIGVDFPERRERFEVVYLLYS